MNIGISIDLSQVRENKDGSIIVGDPSAHICFKGETITKLLKSVKKGERSE